MISSLSQTSAVAVKGWRSNVVKAIRIRFFIEPLYSEWPEAYEDAKNAAFHWGKWSKMGKMPIISGG
jgi:hypothetical protein